MKIKTKNIYESSEPQDGCRVLVMRFWPRGVKKGKIDCWEKELGTSPDLIRKWKGGSISWPDFSKQYISSMSEQKGKIAELAQRAKKETITLLCSCRDAEHCHRELLRQLLLSSTKKKVRRPAASARKK
jgi:uncharacterized protein YeaO (DUF488 family)